MRITPFGSLGWALWRVCWVESSWEPLVGFVDQSSLSATTKPPLHRSGRPSCGLGSAANAISPCHSRAPSGEHSVSCGGPIGGYTVWNHVLFPNFNPLDFIDGLPMSKRSVAAEKPGPASATPLPLAPGLGRLGFLRLRLFLRLFGFARQFRLQRGLLSLALLYQPLVLFLQLSLTGHIGLTGRWSLV